MDEPITQELIANLAVHDIAVSNLRENPENPRQISPGALSALARSIEAEPDMLRGRPVVALPDGRIVAGNMRYRAVKKIGWETIPGIVVEMSEERARLWMLRDNNEYGEWENDELVQILRELEAAEADLELTGFSQEELDELLQMPDELGDEPVDQGDALANMEITLGPPQHQVEKGEVWMCGEHHLVVESIYDGWPKFGPLLSEGALLVPYPTPILPLTKRARENRLVMVQPDLYLAGHLLDKYADAHGGEKVYKVES